MVETSKQEIANELIQKLEDVENSSVRSTLELNSPDCPPECIKISGNCYCPERSSRKEAKMMAAESSSRSRCEPGCFYVRGRCWCPT